MKRLSNHQYHATFQAGFSRNTRTVSTRNLMPIKRKGSSSNISELLLPSPTTLTRSYLSTTTKNINSTTKDSLGVVKYRAAEIRKIADDKKTKSEDGEKIKLRETIETATFKKEHLEKKVRSFEFLFKKLHRSIEQVKKYEVSECLKMIQHEINGKGYLLTDKHRSMHRDEEAHKSRRGNSQSYRDLKSPYNAPPGVLSRNSKKPMRKGNSRIQLKTLQQRSAENQYCVQRQLEFVKNRLENVISKLIAKRKHLT